jgi:type VI secretion system protein ImpF
MATRSRDDDLQPALFDRLEDELGAALSHGAEQRARLEALLTPPQRHALADLLDGERSPAGSDLAPFADLGADAGDLLDRVVALDRARRLELRRNVAVSGERLRRLVLRDLEILLNTVALDANAADDGDLAAFARVRASVVNYGIPEMGGLIGTSLSFEEWAAAVEKAIETFEPRLRSVRVGASGTRDLPGWDPDGEPRLTIEGELWGRSVPERLVVAAFVDPEVDRVRVVEAGA